MTNKVIKKLLDTYLDPFAPQKDIEAFDENYKTFSTQDVKNVISRYSEDKFPTFMIEDNTTGDELVKILKGQRLMNIFEDSLLEFSTPKSRFDEEKENTPPTKAVGIEFLETLKDPNTIDSFTRDNLMSRIATNYINDTFNDSGRIIIEKAFNDDQLGAEFKGSYLPAAKLGL